MTMATRIRRFTTRFEKEEACPPQPHTELPRDSIDAGDFHIDVPAQQAKVRGQALHLTAEEFDLLLFLLRHPRRVVTARTQLNTRWDDEVHQTQFLQVLAALRRKIEAAAGRAGYIRTEPWVLYRFETSR